MFSSFFNKKNPNIKNEKITKLLQQYCFIQQNHTKALLSRLGQQFIHTMSTCALIQITCKNELKYQKIAYIPNIIEIIQNNIDISVQQQHLLMSFGRLYKQKNISFIKQVEKDLKEIILKELQGNNQTMDSTIKLVSSPINKQNNTINNNSKNNISISRVKENMNNLSSSLDNSLQFQSKQQQMDQSSFNVDVDNISSYDFTQNKNINMSKINKININQKQKQKQKRNNLIQSLNKKQQQNASLYNFKQFINGLQIQDDVSQYLKKIANPTVQIELLKNYQPNDFCLKNIIKKRASGSMHIVIFKGRFAKNQFQYNEVGEGNNNKYAKENANWKMLEKVFRQQPELFEHFKQYKKKGALNQR